MWSHGCWAAVDWQWHVALDPPSFRLIVPKQEFRRQPFELETANTRPPERGTAWEALPIWTLPRPRRSLQGQGLEEAVATAQGLIPEDQVMALQTWSHGSFCSVHSSGRGRPLTVSASWGNLFSGQTPVGPYCQTTLLELVEEGSELFVPSSRNHPSPALCLTKATEN